MMVFVSFALGLAATLGVTLTVFPPATPGNGISDQTENVARNVSSPDSDTAAKPKANQNVNTTSGKRSKNKNSGSKNSDSKSTGSGDFGFASNSKTPQLDNVIRSAKATITTLKEKRFARDGKALTAKLKQLQSEFDETISANHHKLMDSPLRQLKQVLDLTLEALQQDKVTPAGAQDVAVTIFEGVINHAEQNREIQGKIDALADKFGEGVEGHEEEFHRGVLKGLQSSR